MRISRIKKNFRYVGASAEHFAPTPAARERFRKIGDRKRRHWRKLMDAAEAKKPRDALRSLKEIYHMPMTMLAPDTYIEIEIELSRCRIRVESNGAVDVMIIDAPMTKCFRRGDEDFVIEDAKYRSLVFAKGYHLDPNRKWNLLVNNKSTSKTVAVWYEIV